MADIGELQENGRRIFMPGVVPLRRGNDQMRDQFTAKALAEAHVRFLESGRDTATLTGVAREVEERTKPHHKAFFDNLDMSEMSFAKMDLRGAEFTSCNLYGVDFTGANLEGAVFRGNVLDHANMRGTRIDGATMQLNSVAEIETSPMRRESIFAAERTRDEYDTRLSRARSIQRDDAPGAKVSLGNEPEVENDAKARVDDGRTPEPKVNKHEGPQAVGDREAEPLVRDYAGLSAKKGTKNEHIHYHDDAGEVFIDRGSRVEFARPQDADAIKAALLHAQAKFGGTIHLYNADEEFLRAATRVAVAAGVRIDNPQVQELQARLLAEQAQERARTESARQAGPPQEAEVQQQQSNVQPPIQAGPADGPVRSVSNVQDGPKVRLDDAGEKKEPIVSEARRALARIVQRDTEEMVAELYADGRQPDARAWASAFSRLDGQWPGEIAKGEGVHPAMIGLANVLHGMEPAQITDAQLHALSEATVDHLLAEFSSWERDEKGALRDGIAGYYEGGVALRDRLSYPPPGSEATKLTDDERAAALGARDDAPFTSALKTFVAEDRQLDRAVTKQVDDALEVARENLRESLRILAFDVRSGDTIRGLADFQATHDTHHPAVVGFVQALGRDASPTHESTERYVEATEALLRSEPSSLSELWSDGARESARADMEAMIRKHGVTANASVRPLQSLSNDELVNEYYASGAAVMDRAASDARSGDLEKAIAALSHGDAARSTEHDHADNEHDDAHELEAEGLER